MHETDNGSNELTEHNYTSFIPPLLPVPHQVQTAIVNEAIRSTLQDQNIPLPWPELSHRPVNEFAAEGLAIYGISNTIILTIYISVWYR